MNPARRKPFAAAGASLGDISGLSGLSGLSGFSLDSPRNVASLAALRGQRAKRKQTENDSRQAAGCRDSAVVNLLLMRGWQPFRQTNL